MARCNAVMQLRWLVLVSATLCAVGESLCLSRYASEIGLIRGFNKEKEKKCRKQKPRIGWTVMLKKRSSLRPYNFSIAICFLLKDDVRINQTKLLLVKKRTLFNIFEI